ncbi:hypothetical protein L1987_54459 [Smallanthus sonchifolius]|uniref:Uncharacterized protein n=1 Tax=Smallanthus sonchifolius TaxID=185202 RepID=A0ACB9E793_9ASTR|nr:hypothetical protein L1987_54459 [Smallanthus sonchifolius]
MDVGPKLVISYLFNDTTRSYCQLHRPEDSTVLVSLACGSLSRIASSIYSEPFEIKGYVDISEVETCSTLLQERNGRSSVRRTYQLSFAYKLKTILNNKKVEPTERG